jgi:hypothetical protein
MYHFVGVSEGDHPYGSVLIEEMLREGSGNRNAVFLGAFIPRASLNASL